MQPMLRQADPITPDQLRRIQARVISDLAFIRRLLDEVRRTGVILRRGMNSQVLPESARVVQVADREIVLETRNFERVAHEHVHLNFSFEGIPYFFSTPPVGEATGPLLRLEIPSTIYQAERRDRLRASAAELPEWPRVISLSTDAGFQEHGEVVDVSPGGLSVYLPEAAAAEVGRARRVHIRGHAGFAKGVFGQVRNQVPAAERPGWVRIGFSTASDAPREPLQVERRGRISPNSGLTQIRERLSLLGEVAAARLQRTVRAVKPTLAQTRQVPVIEYANLRGERIRAIVSSFGPTAGAPTVIIPPAWGRTKETLLPLAETIVETFRRNDTPVSVIRFDGIRKRGESYNDDGCREPGREHLRFSFSQGVDDIRATLDFLEQDPRFKPSRSVLVTFSAASVDGRRAVASDNGKRIGGWVCVVGTADMQSMMRVISGGVDYVAGIDRGVRFGLQEILGVLVDIDHAGQDALDHRLAYLEDSLEDMRRISVPVTWIHGRHDAWMDLERVRLVLGAGDCSKRRLIEVPTGHQLRTSREALESFQLIASEIGRMVTGRTLKPALPSVRRLEELRNAERARLPKHKVELQSFWKDYLLGRSEGRLGIELMTRTTAYQGLMEAQTKRLALGRGLRVADLGAGTGSFLEFLARQGETSSDLTVDALDFVRGALDRVRSGLAAVSSRQPATVQCIACDLGAPRVRASIPMRDNTYDAVLASLLLSYVPDPEQLLREIRRVLRPGGRVVVSSLRKDADISKIFLEGYSELQTTGGTAPSMRLAADHLAVSAREFLNDASRLLDLEESGLFHFWDEAELAALVEAAGFEKVEATSAFGTPPQAIVVSARRS